MRNGGLKAWTVALALALSVGQPAVAAAAEEPIMSAARTGEADKLWKQGKEAADAGELPQAVGLYERSLAIVARPAVWNDLASAMASLERWGEAEKAFERVLAAAPKDADALNGLGYVRYRQDRLEDAIGCYRRAIAQKADPQFHLNLGLAYLAQKRYGDAEREFTRTLALDPAHYWGHNNMGYTLQEQGKLRDAAVAYEAACARADGRITAHLNYGGLLMQVRDYAGAAWIYREGLKQDDGSIDSHLGFALSMHQLNRLDEAYVEARVVQLSGEHPAETRHLLAGIWRDRGETKKAIAEAERAVALAPDQASYHLTLGLLYERDGQIPEAARAYEAFLALSPEDARAPELRYTVRTMREVWGR